MDIRAILTATALVLGLCGPAQAQVQAQAQAQAQVQAPASSEWRSGDPGVLFWTPERRERDFRRMETVVPHSRIAPSASPRPLPAGAPLDIDVSDFMEGQRAAGVLVIQDGKVRLERYGLGFTAEGHWDSFSVTKSVVSTLFGAAIRDGRIAGLDEPVTLHVPEMAGGAYDGVTLRQVLTMTSGVDWNEDYADPDSDVARLFVVEPEPGLDATVSYMRRLGRAAEPGVQWRYNTGETNLAGVILARAVGRSLSDYLGATLWSVEGGMEHPAFWMLDGQGREAGGCCLSASLRDWGRVGLLALEAGALPGGERITPVGWFAEATRNQVAFDTPDRGYGYLWWTGPGDRFDARGIFGQAIHVDPERRLVVVILSAWPAAGGAEHSAARAAFLERVREAL